MDVNKSFSNGGAWKGLSRDAARFSNVKEASKRCRFGHKFVNALMEVSPNPVSLIFNVRKFGKLRPGPTECRKFAKVASV